MADDETYLGPYRDAVDKLGATFEATLWRDPDKQRVRFDVLAELADPTGRVLVDAGCGLGDLAAHLEKRDASYGLYVGLEAIPEFLDEAQARRLPDARFILADFASDDRVFEGVAREIQRPIDLVYFSGSLNTFPPELATVVIERAWDVVEEGVAFNFLSACNHVRNPPDPTPAIRFDPVAMLDWALRLSPSVKFRQDYFKGHDATIAILKPR
jgi:SAM-dependent methyltransferase